MIYLSIEVLVLTVVLAVCVWQFLGKLMPLARANLQARVATFFMHPKFPKPVKRAGFKMLPTVSAHCGSGCNQCGTCAS